MFITYLFSNPVLFFAVIIAVGFSVCVHEFFHAYVALKCGDSTAADHGHLTLNPLKQMGIISIFMLLMLGLCWGAVPVNPARLSRGKRIAVSLAGPAANLGMFIIGAAACLIAIRYDNGEVLKLAVIFTRLNMVLFILNMMPVPGFDGGSVFLELIGRDKVYSSELGKGFMLGTFLLLFCLIDQIYVWSEVATVKVVVLLGKLFL